MESLIYYIMIPYIQLATMHNYTLNATLYELMINIEHE